MIASNAISQHSTDSAALDACIAAGAESCGGVAHNPGLAANIQWSARQTGSTFTMSGVTFFPFTGCRRARARRLDLEDETTPEYQAALPSPDWWQPAYAKWITTHTEESPAPAYLEWQQRQGVERRLQEAEQFERMTDLDDHWAPWNGAKRERTVRKRAARGPLWSLRGLRSPDERM